MMKSGVCKINGTSCGPKYWPSLLWWDIVESDWFETFSSEK